MFSYIDNPFFFFLGLRDEYDKEVKAQRQQQRRSRSQAWKRPDKNIYAPPKKVATSEDEKSKVSMKNISFGMLNVCRTNRDWYSIWILLIYKDIALYSTICFILKVVLSLIPVLVIEPLKWIYAFPLFFFICLGYKHNSVVSTSSHQNKIWLQLFLVFSFVIKVKLISYRLLKMDPRSPCLPL